MKQPCPIICPGRTATCHAECKKYSEYRNSIKANAERRKEIEVDSYRLDTSRKLRRRVNKR